MSFVLHAGGPWAGALICALLFIEEVGIPLPFLPGDVLLFAGGVMISHGHLNPVLFCAGATVSMAGGAMIAYEWSARLGPGALSRVARWLHMERHLARATARLARSSALTVLVCRLAPGLRIYTSIVGGALGIRRREFITGMTISVVVWVAGFTGAGALTGTSVDRVSTDVDVTVFSVLLLAVMLGAAVMAARILRGRLAGASPRRVSRGWASLGVVIDLTVITVSGVISEAFADSLQGGTTLQAWAGALALGSFTAAYLAAAVFSSGGTLGSRTAAALAARRRPG
jgi:membrane-associated protein